MNQEKIGKFIATLRKEHSMTQKELAQQLGVSDKTVSKWETGRGMPEISIMQSLCEILGISINELLSGDKLDASAYREKAEENITELMKRRNGKKIILNVAVSTIPFLVSFLVLPFAAEKIVPPILIPIVVFWSILLIVGNFVAGITYGIVKKWGKLSLFCIAAYNMLLVFILIAFFAMAVIVFSVS